MADNVALVTLKETFKFALGWNGVFWAFRLFGAKALFPKVYGSLNSPMKSYLASTCTSTVHSLAVTALSAMAIYEKGFKPGSFELAWGSDMSSLAIKTMYGFILQDLVLSIYYNKRWSGWVANLMHHIMIIMAWIPVIGHGAYHNTCLYGALMELTTPFVNVHWFCRTANMKDTTLYVANGWAFLISWTVLRVVMYGWVLVGVFFTEEGRQAIWGAPAVLGIPGSVVGVSFVAQLVLGYGLQVMWWMRLVKGAVKQVFGGGSKNHAPIASPGVQERQPKSFKKDD
eukprot:Hpha_TRINITY_DN10844_c0_g1::TRINITY_DN10844_c0_g1_i1::g.23291::m.23291